MADEFNLADLVDSPPDTPELLKRPSDEPQPAVEPDAKLTGLPRDVVLPSGAPELLSKPAAPDLPFDPKDLQDPVEHIKELHQDMYRRAKEGDPTVHPDDLADAIYQDQMGTTPTSRALSKVGAIAKTVAKVELMPFTMAKAAISGKGVGAGVPEEVKGVIGHVLDTDKRMAQEAQQDHTLGAQMTTNAILGAGEGFLNFMSATTGQAITGLTNVAGQMVGEDPKKQAERIATEMIFEGKDRKDLKKVAEMAGAQPEAASYALGEEIGPFLMPGGGAGIAKLSKGIAKVAEATPGMVVKNAARVAEVSKAMAKNPVMHGLAAEAVTGGLTSGIAAGIVSGGVKRAIKSALVKRIIKFATEAVDESVNLPEMPSVTRILRKGDSERTIIENIQQAQRTVMDDLKAKRAKSLENLSLDDKVAVVDKLPSGALAHDITELSKGAKHVRQIDEAIASLESKMNRTKSLARTNKLLSEGVKAGIRVSGSVAVAGGIGGLFGALNDPMSDEGAASGAAFGSMLGSLGALHASKAGRLAVQGDRMFAKGIAHLKKNGIDISHLPPSVQRRIALANGMVAPGGYKLVPMSAEAYRQKFNIPDEAATPNGHYDGEGKTAYVVEEALNSGVLWHEGSHVMDGLSGDIITTAYKDMLKGTKNPEVHASFSDFAAKYEAAMRKTDRAAEGLTSQEIHAEAAAELVRYILQRTPMEELYGGRSFGSTIANKIKQATSSLKGGRTDVMHVPYFDAPFTPQMVDGMMDALYDIGAKSKAESFGVEGKVPESDLAIRPDVRAAVKKYGNKGFISDRMNDEHLINAQQQLGPDATPEDIVGRAHDLAIGTARDAGKPPVPVASFEQVQAHEAAIPVKDFSHLKTIEAKLMPRTADPSLEAVIKDYAGKTGLKYVPHTEYRPLNEEYSKDLADAYVKLEHKPDDPAVRESYDALRDGIMAQYETLVNHGYKIEPWPNEGQPYANSAEMLKDLRDNKHLFYFETERGYGDKGGSTAMEHPMLRGSGVFFNGKEALINDIFRGVHDALGHGAMGFQFGPRGEYNAFLTHASTLPHKSWGALATETIGQNSFTNFGPHMRKPSGELYKKGEPGYVELPDRPFTEQRANTLKFQPHTEAEIGEPAPNLITANEVKGTDSKPMSYGNFLTLRRKGKQEINDLWKVRGSTKGLEGASWDAAKAAAAESVQKEWGGVTLDPATGKNIDLKKGFAMSAKGPRQKTIELPIDASPADLAAAMDRAKEEFNQLGAKDHFLGIFRNENKGTIDIDPVVVVQDRAKVDSIGAYTRAVGGAYDFSTGNGVYPPHVDINIDRAPLGPKLASGAWDSLFVEGEGQAKRAGIAKELGVPEKEFYVRQKPADQQKILDHFKSTGEAQYMPSSHPDAIKDSYVKMPDGKTFYGQTHWDAMFKALDSGRYKLEDTLGAEEALMERAEQGFRTKTGRLLDRDQAEAHAKSIGQYENPEGGGLEAVDFIEGRKFMPAQQETPEFKKWFEGSKAVDENGKPKFLYHGTTQDFTEFNPRIANPENDWGRGIYLSDNPRDVMTNYATSSGPDIQHKLDRTAEGFFDLDPAEAMRRARERFVKHEGATMRLYAKLENPLELGTEKEPYWDYDNLQDLEMHLTKIGKEHEGYDPLNVSEYLAEHYPDGGKAGEVLKDLKQQEFWYDVQDENGNIIGSEVVRQALESMGHDGIIDKTVFKRFGKGGVRPDWGMEGMSPDTTHYVVFDPNNVKSATGNKGTFSKDTSDIRFMHRSIEGFDPDFVQKPPMPDEVLKRAMKIAYPNNTDKTDKIGAHRNIEKGTPLDVRIDIPTYNATKLYSQTLHLPGIGKVQGYDSIVHLDGPISFAMNERMAENVKEGRTPKSPFAVVKGKFNPARDLPPDINNLQEWTPVGINPEKHSYPYDKETHTPVIGGSRAIMIDNTAYIKDAVFGDKKDFKYMPQTAPETQEFKRWSKGAPVVLDAGVHPRPLEEMGYKIEGRDETGYKVVSPNGNVISEHKTLMEASDAQSRQAFNASESEGGRDLHEKFKTGEPVVVGAYHGTPSKEFHVFDEAKAGEYTGAPSAKEGFFFSGSTDTADTYRGGTIFPNKGYHQMLEADKSKLVYSLINEVEQRYGGLREMSLDQFVQEHPEIVERVGSEIIGKPFDMTYEPEGHMHEVYVKFENPLVHDYKGEAYREQSYYDVLKSAKRAGHDGAILLNTYDGAGKADNIFVAFDNKNIKSTANKGTFDPSNPDIRYMPRTPEEMPSYIESYKQKYPDAKPIEFMKNKQGEYRFPKNSQTKQHEAVPQTYGYDLENTPLAEAAKKGAKDDKEARVRTVKAYVDKMMPEAQKALEVPEVAAARGWYRVFKEKIQSKLDAMGLGEHVDKFMEIVSATSPQNDPWNNFMYAIDAWNKWRKGEYDDIIQRYHEEYAKFQNGELTTPTGKKMESVGQFEDYLSAQGIAPTRITKEGKEGKFGKNTPKTMHALAGTFLDTAGKLKIHQFVHNLLQKDLNATIDMWAARTLHRLGWEGGKEKQWRLLPFQESGVTDIDFRLGQDVFREVAKRLDMSTDDLQALMWFHEKKQWYDKGYSAKLDYGDFRPLVDYAHPEEGGTFRYEPDLKAYRAATGTQKKK